ncbi:uncharacterized protein LOC126653928 [Mercurialis annua]|uniref:uncharacterized protein LOC126653928 n=1 Tax=Mercurialis annua TaxID=3986 RepID=UPI00215FA2A4|nr:uncharacterized protein LOC126653928 [Mercurialis annua]XP_050203887.1 uncharacterized protein LOC126653928 [Mercurialis annua]
MGAEQCNGKLTWMMDREREFEVDIESGGTTSDDDGMSDSISGNTKVLNSVWSGRMGFDGLISSSKFCDDENVELLLDNRSEGEEAQQQHVGFGKKKVVEENHKKKNSRKAPKPPRPPKGPALDAADQKFVQEIAELALRKRARMERIKALKKMRGAKSSSWNSSLYAMIITVIFCLIFIFQGICARSNGGVFLQGSPEPAVAASEDLISIQFYNKPSSGSSSGSDSPNLAEGQVSGSGLRK